MGEFTKQLDGFGIVSSSCLFLRPKRSHLVSMAVAGYGCSPLTVGVSWLIVHTFVARSAATSWFSTVPSVLLSCTWSEIAISIIEGIVVFMVYSWVIESHNLLCHIDAVRAYRIEIPTGRAHTVPVPLRETFVTVREYYGFFPASEPYVSAAFPRDDKLFVGHLSFGSVSVAAPTGFGFISLLFSASWAVVVTVMAFYEDVRIVLRSGTSFARRHVLTPNENLRLGRFTIIGQTA